MKVLEQEWLSCLILLILAHFRLCLISISYHKPSKPDCQELGFEHFGGKKIWSYILSQAKAVACMNLSFLVTYLSRTKDSTPLPQLALSLTPAVQQAEHS